MENKLNEYTKLFYLRLSCWADRLGLYFNSNHIWEMNKLIPKYIEKIINNGNKFILTNDYLNYLCFYACFRQRYGERGNNNYYLSALYSKLDHLATSNDIDIEKAISNYYFFLLFGDEMNESQKVDFYKLMNNEDRKMFEKCLEIRSKICDTSHHYYETEILKRMLIKITYYCKKYNNYKHFYELISKYFDNPKYTIEIFKLRGLIKESDTVSQFDTYITQGFNIDNKEVIAK